jgi:hypothetical protein
LGIDLFKSVLMYSNGAICLIKLLFKMGLFTVCKEPIPKIRNNHIHVSVSDLCIPRIDLPVLLQKICGPILEKYKFLTDT